MEHGPGMKMYFLLKMGISQPAMWVYQRVSIIFCQKIIWLWYSKSQFSHLIWQIWSDWAVGVLTWISRGTMWCGWSVPICDTTSLLERNHKDFFFFSVASQPIIESITCTPLKVNKHLEVSIWVFPEMAVPSISTPSADHFYFVDIL